MEIESIKNVEIAINKRKDCLDAIKYTLPNDINEIIINLQLLMQI